MATYIIKNLKTTEQRSYEDQPARGAEGFEEAWGRAKQLEYQLNTSNRPGPWRLYIDGESVPTTCPACGAEGPF